MSDASDRWYLSGPLGIGTAEPKGTLHIAESGNQWSDWNLGTSLLIQGGEVERNPAIGIFDPKNANPWAIHNGEGELHLSQMPELGNTSEPPRVRLKIDKDGKVGIGTTTPGHQLSVAGSIGASALTFVDQEGTPYQDNWIGMAANVEATPTKWLHIGGIRDAGVRRLALYADRTYFSGNVGIGATDPKAKLEVNGGGGTSVDFRVNGRLRSDNNDGGLWISADRFVGGHATNQIGFYNGSAWQLTVQNNGNVGIGVISPQARLHVSGDTLITGKLQWTNNPDSGDGYVRLGNLQICWGKISFSMNDSDHQYQRDITFSKPFFSTPVVTISLDDPGYGSDAMDTVVGALNKQADKFTVVVKRLNIATYYLHAGPIEVSWIAVGKK